MISSFFKDLNHSHILLLFSILIHIYFCPYTKVEESFNLQAIHDMLFKSSLKQFDHFYFPGVVPRTCLGSLLISAIAFPILLILKLLNLIIHFNIKKIYIQILCRSILGILSWLSFVHFSNASSKKFCNKRIGNLISLITAVQFHLPFYMSRTLPNIFALILCTHAWAYWLKVYNLFCLVNIFIIILFIY
jgi:alpha-1,6-mannosyltransferase